MTTFSFGHRTTVAANTSTYLPGTGGTNQAAEISLVIPHAGTLKNLYWDCQSNGLTGVGNKFTVKIGALHATPTSAAPALTDALVVSIDGKTNGTAPFNFPVVAGQRIGVQVQNVTGGTSISRLRVSFELEGAAPAGQVDLSTRVQTLMNADLPSMNTHYAQAFIMQDGTVKISGNPRYGNLGSGNYENIQMRPVPLTFGNQNIGPIASVILNYHGGHALTAAGDVWGWGYNGSGQVGDGSYTTRYYPVPLFWGAYTKPKIVQLACSTREEYSNYDHASWYARDDNNRVWAWGLNGNGQLGINNTVAQSQPYLTDITDVVDIEASGGFFGSAFAIKSDGTVWSAGYNGWFVLGLSGWFPIWRQVNLPGPCIKVRSTGSYEGSYGIGHGHTLFLLADGRVFSTGHNGYGQLGNGITSTLPPPNTDPAPIPSLSNIVDIWVGGSKWGCSFAVNASGDLFVWGYNGLGQLGIGIGASGGPENKNIPVPHAVKNVKSVKIGGSGSSNHTLLLTQSGQVYSAGLNDFGKLGLGIYEQSVSTYTHNLMLLPPNVQGNIVQIGVSGASNWASSQLLDNNGYVWACGNNTGHHLGVNPSFGDRHTMPTRVMF